MNKKLTRSALDVAQDALNLLDNMYEEVKDLCEQVEWLNCQLEQERSKRSIHQTLIDMIKDGKFIPAIKFHREKFGSDLRTAKHYCDELRLEILRGKHGPIKDDLYWYIRKEYNIF